MNNTYKQIKNDLTSKEKFHINLGLERISQILELFDNPQNKIKTVHIAGTNGKGSVSAMLCEILKNSGYKTGLYTSPHLVKYNERIKISSKDISDEDFNKLLNQVNETAKLHNIPLTEFEVLTAVAFIYFAKEQVDIAIIEVGLGGRLDATNVITPLFEIITSISLDHTERLGNTIEQIAYEKAGIIKPNSTVIVNAQNLGLDTIKQKANETSTKIKIAPIATSVEFQDGKNKICIDQKHYKISLIGEFQGENLSLVLKAIETLNEKGFVITNIEKSLLSVVWPARMQFLKPNVILDGAHNPSAAKSLRTTLDKNFQNIPRIWFFGALKNKDFKQNINILFEPEDIVYFVKFNLHNSCTEEEFQEFTNTQNRFFIDIEALPDVLQKSQNTKNLAIICGSLYLAGEVLAQLASQQSST
jgi:dihydrofolate synthase/folylpolyglutamate synthase